MPPELPDGEGLPASCAARRAATASRRRPGSPAGCAGSSIASARRRGDDVNGTMTPHRAEEILEHVFTEREEGRDAAAGILARRPPPGARAGRARGGPRASSPPRGSLRLDGRARRAHPRGRGARARRGAAPPAHRAALPRPARPRRADDGGPGLRVRAHPLAARRPTRSARCSATRRPARTASRSRPASAAARSSARSGPLVTGLRTFDVGRHRPHRLHRAEVPRPDGPARRARGHPRQHDPAPPALARRTSSRSARPPSPSIPRSPARSS